MVDYGSWAEWTAVALTVWGTVAGSVWIRARYEFAPKRDVDALYVRVRALEVGMADLPSKVDMAQMKGRMDLLTERMGNLNDTMERIERPLNIMVDSKLRQVS